MFFRKLPLRSLVWLGALVFSAVVLCYATDKKPSKAKGADDKRTQSNDDILTKDGFLRIKIEVSKEGVKKLRPHNWGWGESQKERPSVQATIYEGGKVYTNVALHLKGAAGSFRPVDDRPAFTLNFDKFAKGQDFHGLDKISLNNSVQDSSYLSEKICREMFISAGVPTPRATHTRVEFNGRDLGVYVLVEGWGKQFLKRYFKNAKGNLYDGGFVKDITDPDLDVNSGEKPKDHSDLKRLAEAANEPDGLKRMQRLEQVLDMDRFLTMIALEVMMGHWDGYAMNKNNYRIFHDAERDKMVFMPHGMDQMFGVMRPLPDSPMPHMEGLVARAVVQTSEGRRRYMQRMSQLLTNVFNVEAITNRVRTIAAQVRPAFAERSQSSAHQFDGAVQDLCSRIVQRGRSLQQQLSIPSDTLAFDSSGIARLTKWKSKKDYGNPSFDETRDADGKSVLHISMNSGSGVGSWCTRVMLESGKYRLEGRVKTQAVTPDPGDLRGGAGLRISGRPRFNQKLTETADWTDLAFEFEITEGVRDTELRCELRAGKGEAWFETDSLRLVRK